MINNTGDNVIVAGRVALGSQTPVTLADSAECSSSGDKHWHPPTTPALGNPSSFGDEQDGFVYLLQNHQVRVHFSLFYGSPSKLTRRPTRLICRKEIPSFTLVDTEKV